MIVLVEIHVVDILSVLDIAQLAPLHKIESMYGGDVAHTSQHYVLRIFDENTHFGLYCSGEFKASCIDRQVFITADRQGFILLRNRSVL
jgi:hypothetical protein